MQRWPRQPRRHRFLKDTLLRGRRWPRRSPLRLWKEMEAFGQSLDEKRHKQADKEAEHNAAIARLSEEIADAPSKRERRRLPADSGKALQANGSVTNSRGDCRGGAGQHWDVHDSCHEGCGDSAMAAAVEQLCQHLATRSSEVTLAQLESRFQPSTCCEVVRCSDCSSGNVLERHRHPPLPLFCFQSALHAQFARTTSSLVTSEVLLCHVATAM